MAEKKKKKSIFEQRNEELDDIYNYQQGGQAKDTEGVNPNEEAEAEYPNLKKKGKKRGLFG